MLRDERRHYLLERLKQEGRIIAKEISQELDVSEDTIRRDLRELAQEGLLQRVHGGALPASPALVDYTQREDISSGEKAQIGQAAASMIKEGQVVILDGGTTAMQVARHLPAQLKATIITHSAQIAVALVDHPAVEVILIGGRLYKHSIVSVGASALEAIKRVYADIYFMGVTGIHVDAGLTTGDFEEASIKYALSQQAADTYVLASSEKLGAASPYAVASIDEVSGLIVSAEVEPGALVTYQERRLDIIYGD